MEKKPLWDFLHCCSSRPNLAAHEVLANSAMREEASTALVMLLFGEQVDGSGGPQIVDWLSGVENLLLPEKFLIKFSIFPVNRLVQNEIARGTSGRLSSLPAALGATSPAGLARLLPPLLLPFSLSPLPLLRRRLAAAIRLPGCLGSEFLDFIKI